MSETIAEPSPLRRGAGSLAARLLGAVLLVAAYAKGIDPAAFALQLGGLLPLAPAAAGVVAVVVIGFEAGLGAALLAGWRSPAVLAITNLLFVWFIGVVAWEMIHPNAAGGSCGCFGNLVERTPQQALLEDVGFLGLSGVAWMGRTARASAPRRLIAGVAAAAGIALAVAAPSLPLDDRATALAPGVPIAATHLDEIVPALRTGRHLVLLLDRADPTTVAAIPLLNQHLLLPGGKTKVWGFAADDPNLAAAFLWSAGPAFEVRSVPLRMLRTLYRTLPRSALIDDGRVLRTWTGFPPDPALAALARGEPPP